MNRPARSRPLRGPLPGQLSLPFGDSTLVGVRDGPVSRADGLSSRFTLLGSHRIDYWLRRSRRRTIGFLIDERGLTVSAPRWLTLSELESALQEKARWIVRKMVEWRDYERRRDSLAIRWEHGQSLRYLGQSLVMVVDRDVRGVLHDTDRLRVGLPPNAAGEQLRDRVQGWLQGEARRIFAERIPVFAERLGRGPSRWGLSSARTRWGSCSADGVIRLNWRLVHFPLDVIDYVVAHEIAHLRELNHSDRFWATVGELLPGFARPRDRLRLLHDEGHEL